MRISGIILAAGLALGSFQALPAPAHAQTQQDNFEVTFQARETQRRASIASTMRFNEEEATEFWPIYDLYRITAKSHQLRRLRMLKRLSENAVEMDQATASALVAGAISLEAEQQSAKQKYISDLAPHFSGSRYFRLYQLETKLDALFRYGWTKKIPLAITETELEMLQSSFDAAAEAKKLSEIPDA